MEDLIQDYNVRKLSYPEKIYDGGNKHDRSVHTHTRTNTIQMTYCEGTQPSQRLTARF
jgi:hypothetical protein